MNAGHRRVWLLAGEPGASRAAAGQALADIPAARQLWVSHEAPRDVTRVDAARAGTVLGAEFDALVFDLWDGFDPDALGAVAGTVRGGGHLLLLAPRLDDWPEFDDPDAERILVAPYRRADIAGRFLARAARLTGHDPAVRLVDIDAGEPLPNLAVPPRPETIHRYRTEDQHAAVDAIAGLLEGPPHHPLVLVSDRGRGKSSALGLAAADCMQAGPVDILVTAPRIDAAANVFARAAEALEPGHASRTRIEADEATMQFVAPDALVEDEAREADLLLVDEAAAIPVPILTALLDRFPRVVFATTVHGYEGTGRGFAVRFRAVLDRETPHWRELTLERPVRWDEDDPAEAWVARVLALDAEPVAADRLAEADLERLSIEPLDRDALAADDALLDELFGLLVLAHYRTRPYDLKHLLDGPNITVWVARIGGHVVGTALSAREGGLEESLAKAVFQGHRRLRGHLIPQSLAAHLGLPEAAALKGERVLRIAVHPAVRGRGIGSRILNTMREAAQLEGLSWFGTSFGATHDLFRFWRRLGLVPLRLGVTREAASGTHSLMMVAPLSERSRVMLARARRHFAHQLPLLLTDAARHLPPELATDLLTAADAAEGLALDADDWRILAAFAHEQFGFEDALGAIHALAMRALADAELAQCLHPNERLGLVERVIEHRGWDEVAEALELPGRRDVIRLLRTAVGRLVAQYRAGDAADRCYIDVNQDGEY